MFSYFVRKFKEYMGDERLAGLKLTVMHYLSKCFICLNIKLLLENKAEEAGIPGFITDQ